MTTIEAATFEVGPTIRRAVNALTPHLPAFALVAVVCGGFPNALLGWIGLERSSIYSWIFNQPPPSDTIARLAIDLPAALVPQLVWFLATGWMCGVLLDELKGEASGRSSDLRWLRRTVPLCLLALLSATASSLGLLLLIVPGVIFGLASAVAVPALVSEGLGPLEALRRSFELTRGVRGTIFGVAVVNDLAAIAFNFVGALMTTGNLIASRTPVVVYLRHSPQQQKAAWSLERTGSRTCLFCF
ncbi:hypothetical protein ACO2Q3_12225 [Caulobacter sp. KR2-114]|uniref:hypothetical protein n=1 Tax=Caulobacter sp. KR2-114 TaxID=3400912 RepID=UPI003C02EB50